MPGEGPKKEENMTERAFIENWWKRKFPAMDLPSTLTFNGALDLLTAFRGTGDARWATGPKEKHFLEAWWQRRFPAAHLRRDCTMPFVDAEDLLIQFRKSTEALWPKRGQG